MARNMRATGWTTGGLHFCTACRGTGRCVTRTWTHRGWERSYGKCPACRGKGGKWSNHAPKDAGRTGFGGRVR